MAQCGGGELLLGDYRGFERRAWLKPAPLIGGDRAQAEPWRNALVRLDATGLSDWADALFPEAPRDLARQAAAKGINAPMSSSAGRLFDAVAACLGLCPMRQSYEGEAAMRLAALAGRRAAEPYPFTISAGEIDPAPMFAALRADLGTGADPGQCAARFQQGLAAVFAQRAADLVQTGAAQAVALSGGCYQNAQLLRATQAALDALPVLTHKTTPANDGGLALGQAIIAAAQSESD